MLNIINDPSSELLFYVKDDPVRPEIPVEFRVTKNKFIGALVEEKPLAMICVALLNHVPTTVEDLVNEQVGNVAVFYTVWSYSPGSAAKLVFDVVDYIKANYPTVTRFVTLSPKTEMARKFHIKNGAHTLCDNESSVNYEYYV
jgi:hypothetical protein